MPNNSCAFNTVIGNVKTGVRLVSWLGEHLISGNHNSANLHPILGIKVLKSELGFYLIVNNLLTYICLKLSYSCLTLSEPGFEKLAQTGGGGFRPLPS